MGRLDLVWFVGVALVSSACSGGGEDEGQGGGLDSGGSSGSGGKGGSAGTGIILGGSGGSNSGGTGGTSNGGSSSGSGGSVPCPSCENSLDACVVITVTRGSDTANQPWVLWPDEADGVGTLVVSAYPSAGSGTTVRREVTETDFTSPSANYEVDLGCVPAGQHFLGAFLDDDLDAAAGTVFSSDYIDSCPMERQPVVTIPTGAILEYEFVLTNSCD